MPLGRRLLHVTSRALAASTPQESLRRTALYSLHKQCGGTLVPFAGWEMPVLYADMGVAQSALHTRTFASLFDVSHMLQTRICGPKRVQFMEMLTVADVAALPEHGSTLSVFTNPSGGIIDDTIINKQHDHLYVVSNAACADKDLKHLHQMAADFVKSHGKGSVSVDVIEDQSLLALQGPWAVRVLEELTGEALQSFPFMSTRRMPIKGISCNVSRSGYTGEDGFEIQVPSAKAQELASLLLDKENICWAGLGARDSLRLEAGMCLYGHDLDDTTSPVEAGLTWTIGKRRRTEGGFLGATTIQKHLKEGVERRRVGFLVDGAPAREGAEIFDMAGEKVGVVTSGGPSPCLKRNIAMGYIKTGSHKSGTAVQVRVRQKMNKASVAKMPFVSTRYHKV